MSRTESLPFNNETKPTDALIAQALALRERGFVAREYRDHQVVRDPARTRTYDRRFVVVAPVDDVATTDDDTGLGINIAYGMMCTEGEDRTVQVAFRTAEKMHRSNDGIVHQAGVLRMNTMLDFRTLTDLLAMPPQERVAGNERVQECKAASPAAYLAARHMRFIH